MTKLFCDKCGKEIIRNPKAPKYELLIREIKPMTDKLTIGANYYKSNYATIKTITRMDLCTQCANNYK